jgi:ABC-2 type transport system ATP-binding protein
MSSSDTIVRTQALTKQFDNHTAVKEVSLEINRGEIYGLIGPNGAGKTTLIRMLAAAEEPTIGEIYINGQQLKRGQNNPQLKRQIGFLPDDFPLYEDLTVWDYLDYFARLYFLKEAARKERISQVISLVSLEEKAQSLTATLSRGMRQRLSLARSIIHSPTFLLLDEPVSGLDPVARVEVRNIIKALQSEGMTILISSHILSDLEEICTSIGVMELGVLVESSKLEAIYQRSTQQRITIITTGELERLHSILENHQLVSNISPEPTTNAITIEISGGLEESAQLLKQLILANIPIADFHRTQESLEDIFFKMGYKRTA